MKLAISTLVLVGLSQICSAYSNLEVEVLSPTALTENYEVCINIHGCQYPCVQLSSAFSMNYVTPYPLPECVLPNGNDFPDIIAFEDLANPHRLAYLVYGDDPTPYFCTRGGETDTGKMHNCDLSHIFDLPDTTTTTTTTTATTTTTSVGTTSSSTTTGTTTTTTGTTTTGAKTSSSTTTGTTTTSSPVSTCLNKDTIFGKKRGNGYSGDCCKTEADCLNECIKGKCNGPKKAITTTTKKPATSTKKTTTTKKVTITTKKPEQTPAVCKPGYLGKKKGSGSKGACCTTHWDCKEECIKGSCN